MTEEDFNRASELMAQIKLCQRLEKDIEDAKFERLPVDVLTPAKQAARRVLEERIHTYRIELESL